jgi:hypothetical protein
VFYVDGSYTGTDADGTETRPFPTIQQALDSASDGASIAIAAGTYAESLTTSRRVSILGRCPSMVTIAPPVGSEHGIRLDGSGCTVRGLTVDGGGHAQFGLRLVRGRDHQVEDVVVHSSLDYGIYCVHCTTTLDHVTVRDVDPASSSAFGTCILVATETSPGTGMIASHIDVDGCDMQGLLVADASIDLSSSRISGCGIASVWLQSRVLMPDATIASSILEDSNQAIVATADASVHGHISLTRNQLRDIHLGLPVSLVSSTGPITMRENHIVGSVTHAAAIVAHGGPLLVTGNRMEDTTGLGLTADYTGTCEVSHNTTRRTGGFGLYVSGGSDAEIAHNSVAHIVPGPEGVGLGIFGIDLVSPVLRRNEAHDVDEALSLQDCTGSAAIEGNLVTADRLGIGVEVLDLPETEHLISGNRILDGGSGITVGECSLCTSAVTLNTIGPITLSGESTTGALMQVGINVAVTSSSTVQDNVVIMRPADDPGLWSLGILLYDTGGSILGNQVMGGGTSGINVTSTALSPAYTVEVASNTVAGGRGGGIQVYRITTAGETYLTDNRVAGITEANLPSGMLFGDGIVLVRIPVVATVEVTGNVVVANERAGLFVSDAPAQASGNTFFSNTLAVAWQDGAVVDMGPNAIGCNGNDQPVVDGGLDVPEPPPTSLPP